MRIVKIVTICPALLQLIAPSQQRAPRGRVAVRAGQIEAEGIGEPVVDVEQDADLDRVLNTLVAHAGGADWLQIDRPHVRRGEREFLEEPERRPQPGIERGGAPIRQHRCDQPVVLLFVFQGQRRDRAVSARSEHTLVQAGRERGEQFPLAHAPR